MAKTVEERLLSERKSRGTLLFVLVDSENPPPDGGLGALAEAAATAGASAILVGGSSATDQADMSQAVRDLRGPGLPVVLFPGNVTGVVPGADAILFTSLLNSENPYFITQAQALGAPAVLKLGLEPLPTGYIVIGEGTSAWFVGSARGIPRDKPKIAAAYSLAARFLGMRFVYLEAGSGAPEPLPPEMVAAVRKVYDGFLIVGGGIRDAASARALSEAGADALVVGTLVERQGPGGLAEMARALGERRVG